MDSQYEADFDEFVVASWPSPFRMSFLLMGDYQLAEDVLRSHRQRQGPRPPRRSDTSRPLRRSEESMSVVTACRAG